MNTMLIFFERRKNEIDKNPPQGFFPSVQLQRDGSSYKLKIP
jgi:hypothetical protein